jgi:hypothetical protein
MLSFYFIPRTTSFPSIGYRRDNGSCIASIPRWPGEEIAVPI